MTKYLYAYTHSSAAKWRRAGQSALNVAIKIGETKRPGEERVREQLRTAFPGLKGVTIFFHSEEALTYEGLSFGDRDVHGLLKAAGVERLGGEWFGATVDEVRSAIISLQTGQPFELSRTLNFEPRDEQREAVSMTASYFRRHGPGSKFLWNAKMRFGKTFSTYLLAKEMGWSKILVLTYKPAVRSAWKTDLLTHAAFNGWNFIDTTIPDQLASDFTTDSKKFAWFASFQDVTGRSPSGERKAKNERLHEIEWDCIVIDEFHFGASSPIARELYDPQDKMEVELAQHLEQVADEDESLSDISTGPLDLGLKSKFQLHLSGTPFKAIARGDYNEDQIFDWTYIQEQKKKREFAGPDSPYRALPSMEIYSYSLDGEDLSRAIDQGRDEFSLSQFFKAVKRDGKFAFERPDEVEGFLNLIRGVGVSRNDETYASDNYPYSGSRFVASTTHSIWLMSDVAQCEAMYEKLVKHPFFKSYEVHKAVGPKAGVGANALPPVKESIKRSVQNGSRGSITLTCGKLMTGVTVEEWSSIFMLTTLRAPESYFQAAFRVQSPWVEGSEVKKESCYVFEFDPHRALSLVASYASQMAMSSSSSPGVSTKELDELLQYLPIYAIADGEMERLDSDSLLQWANSGLTANSLARKCMSPSLFDLSARTLELIINDSDLLEELSAMDDFRDFYTISTLVISTSDRIRELKRGSNSKKSISNGKKKLAKAKGELRQKLRKLNARIMNFMYLTDFREERLDHIIQALDRDLFLLATGLKLDSFKKLTNYGVFKPGEMAEVIQKYRYFERQSLLAHYEEVLRV